MLFNSYEFLFVFLPLVLLAYHAALHVAGLRGAKVVLVIASLVFYAFSRVDHLAILLASLAVNYLLARRILALGDASDGQRKGLMVAGIVFNLGLLGFFKYANFLVGDVFGIAQAIGWERIVLPIAISFFTFQQIAFLVDARRREVRHIDGLDYCLFVTFFPQLIAGPIVHHKEMMPQFAARRRGPDWTDVAVGLTLLAFGLAKKVVLADSVAVYATPIFGAADGGFGVTTVEAWIAALAYTLQLYFDFSGYSDMAIGLARLFGIRLPTNFYSPYKSTSIVDFWRRWHMTLSRFLRDYLYIPLGGSRVSEPRRYLNLFLTMLLGGIWHGAGWTFVVWGALHGVYLALNHFWIGITRKGPLSHLPSAPRAFKIALTLLAVIVAWVFFRATTLSGGYTIFSAMFCLDGGCTAPLDMRRYLSPLEAAGLSFAGENIVPLSQLPVAIAWIAGLMAVALFLPNTHQIMRRYRPTIDAPVAVEAPTRLRWRPSGFGLAWAVLAALSSILLLGRATEFLYFQF